jgi:hypothetical protein
VNGVLLAGKAWGLNRGLPPQGRRLGALSTLRLSVAGFGDRFSWLVLGGWLSLDSPSFHSTLRPGRGMIEQRIGIHRRRMRPDPAHDFPNPPRRPSCLWKAGSLSGQCGIAVYRGRIGAVMMTICPVLGSNMVI